MRALAWDDGDVVILDQTLLPHREEHRALRTTEEIVEAIRAMRVRGAPALGIVGAMGVAQAALRASGDPLGAGEAAGAALKAARPTAVNLGWAIERALARAPAVPAAEVIPALVAEALAIQAEDEAACAAMAKHALEFFPREGTVLTHCNTGALVTGGIGTALGAITHAVEQGYAIEVLATETRPLLQGARLTAWELGRAGVPHAIVVDAAAAGLIARGGVRLVIVGADRVAVNGDVANKVGTYALALAAADAGIPFVVVAPRSTVDAATPDGGSIEIEERAGTEVTHLAGTAVAAPRSVARNPAFDVTPARLVTAIVTEAGVHRPPFETLTT